MKDVDEVRERVLRGTLTLIGETGFRFTMDSLAKSLGMSKKTIYAVFPDKETLLTNLVDEVFDDIGREQEQVISDPSLDTAGKLRGILCVMPTQYMNVDISEVYSLRDKFPVAAARMMQRLEENWEPTFKLLDEGMDSGAFRKFDKRIFQLTYEAATERFLQGDELARAHIPYMEALGELVGLMVDGILA